MHASTNHSVLRICSGARSELRTSNTASDPLHAAAVELSTHTYPYTNLVTPPADLANGKFPRLPGSGSQTHYGRVLRPDAYDSMIPESHLASAPARPSTRFAGGQVSTPAPPVTHSCNHAPLPFSASSRVRSVRSSLAPHGPLTRTLRVSECPLFFLMPPDARSGVGALALLWSVCAEARSHGLGCM